MKLLTIMIGLLLIGCTSETSPPQIPKVKQEAQQVIEDNETVVHPHEIAKKDNSEELQNGDLIFHTSRSSQSKAIQIVTDSKYSHMGIIYQEGTEFFVYEAVQPTKMTKLNEWIDRGENKEYVVKRLKNSSELLTKEGLDTLKSEGKKYLGKDYDVRFEWSDDKIYCSELVWKMYKQAFNIEIGKLERIGDFNISNSTVQTKVKERYGSAIPKDELVITPDRMFNSNKLITVRDR